MNTDQGNMTKLIFAGDEYSRQPAKLVVGLSWQSQIASDMTNEILCPIDFSESSIEALKCSISLAKKMKSKLTILYTYRLFKHNGEALAQRRGIEEEAAKKFDTIEQELLKGTGLSYQFCSEIGFVEGRIGEHARSNKISFLVMADEMRRKITESFDQLVTQIHVPLIIVP